MSQVFDYNDLSIGVKKAAFEGSTDACKEWCADWLIRNNLGTSITWRLDNNEDLAARAYDPDVKRERLFFIIERPEDEKGQAKAFRSKTLFDRINVLPEPHYQIRIGTAYFFDLPSVLWEDYIRHIQSIDGTKELEFQFEIDGKPVSIVVRKNER